MSLFSSRSPFDDQVDEATSELIPNGEENLGLNFEICDQIRGKLVAPKDAMRALKRRLNHQNPNVQLLTLKLTDLCIKNGGDHFLVEIASQEFVSTLAALVRNHQLPHQVRTPLLQDFQAWARAFRNRPSLDNMYSTYVQLRNEGYPFPPGDDNAVPTRVVLDTSVPPEWSDSPVCERCRTQFTFTNRKHHCRACGHTFCGECSSKNIPLAHLGIPMPVRVCDGCFARGGKSPAALAAQQQQQQQQQQVQVKPTTGSGPQLNRKEQEDLDLAIALSLAEADKQQQPATAATTSSRQLQQAAVKQSTGTGRQKQAAVEDEEDDPDLAAAISASIAELELEKSKRPGATSSYRNDPSWSPQRKPSSASSTAAIREHNTGSSSVLSNAAAPAAAERAERERDTLTATEMETIDLFAAAMAKLELAGPGAAQTLIANREYAALHQSMTALHPRVVAQVHETLAVHKQLEEMHDKLTRAIRAYEEAVDARLRMPPGAMGAGPGIAPSVAAPVAGGYAQVSPPQQQQQQQQQQQPGYDAYMRQQSHYPGPPPQQQPQAPGPYGGPPVASVYSPPPPLHMQSAPPATSATPPPVQSQPYMGPPPPGYPPTTMSPPPATGTMSQAAPAPPLLYPADPNNSNNYGYAPPPNQPGGFAPPAPSAYGPTPMPPTSGPNYAYGPGQQPPTQQQLQGGFMPGLMPPLMPTGSASPPAPAQPQPPKDMPPLIDLS